MMQATNRRPRRRRPGARIRPAGLGLICLVLGACSGPPESTVEPTAAAQGPAAGAPEDSIAWTRAVEDRIAATEYAIVESAGALRAANQAHGFDAAFAPDGLAITPRPGGGGPLRKSLEGWELRLRTSAWGRRERLEALEAQPARPGACREDGTTDVRGRSFAGRRSSIPGCWSGGSTTSAGWSRAGRSKSLRPERAPSSCSWPWAGCRRRSRRIATRRS